MQEIFEENRSELLSGAIVWTPMLAPDNFGVALQQETKFPDARVKHFWDPDRLIGKLVSATLNLKTAIAWDVYLIYHPDHPWDVELPPPPKFWMHQLDEEPILRLDPPHLKRYVQILVEELSQGAYEKDKPE